MRLLKWLLVFAAMTLGASCAPSGNPITDQRYGAGPQPAEPTLNVKVPFGTTRYSNASLADLFTRLSHDLEWGGRRPGLVRLEAPISVGMTGCCTSEHAPFLDSFLAQMRARMGIAISRRTAPHNLIVNLVPGSDFRARVPAHLCVVAPGRLPWSRFRESPERFGTRAFEERRNVSAMSVYIPDTAAPYLIRRCLIEEVTQALGLANDLNGLGDTIFNDDGAHIWPTALDYLMLRTLYAAELRTGLNRQETTTRARQVLDRIHPDGATAPPLAPLHIRQMADWSEALGDAFDLSRSKSAREESAKFMLTLARQRLPDSVYHCRALVVAARLTSEPEHRRLAILNRAESVCRRAHGPEDPRLDLIALSQARALFRLGRISEAYGISQRLEPRLAAHGQAERLVALFALQAAALNAIQQPESSVAVRRKAVAWAQYALGRNHPEVQRLDGK